MSDTSTTPAPAANLVGQLRALWTRLPARARTAALAATVGIVGFVAYLVLSGGGGSWKKVTDGLTPTDAKELIGVLNDEGISSRLSSGTVVEVPAAQLAQARAAAAVARIPRSKGGLELLEKTVFGASSEQERHRYQHALQNHLAREIEQLAPISRAGVTLAFGARSVYKSDARPATAGVRVSIRPGMTLSSQQVMGIKQTVANSVTGLDVDHVSVIDQTGAPLSSDDQRAGDDQLELEGRLADNVRRMLETVTGPGKVRVVAQVDLDRRAVQKTEEHFDTPVVLSKQETTTGGGAAPTTGGVVGVAGNLAGAPAPTAGAVATGAVVTQSTINHQIPRTITQIAEAPVRVARVHLAVLVDQPLDDQGAPVARPEAEMKQLEQLARTAAGFDAARGDQLTFHSMPFAPVEAPVAAPPAKQPFLPVPLPYAGAGVAALALVIIVLLARRRKPAEVVSSASIALPAPVAELERALSPATAGEQAAAGSPALPSGRTLEERVLNAVRGDVGRATRVLASWLQEPDPSAPAPKPPSNPVPSVRPS